MYGYIKPDIFTAFFILFFFRSGGVFTVYTNKYKIAAVKHRRRKEPPIVCVFPPFILAFCNCIKVKTQQYFFHLFYHFYFMEWISLFEITNTYYMVYKWFTVLKNEYNAECLSCKAYSTSGFHGSCVIIVGACCENPAGTNRLPI